MLPIVITDISVSTLKKLKTNSDRLITTNRTSLDSQTDKMSNIDDCVDKKTHLGHIFLCLKMRLW